MAASCGRDLLQSSANNDGAESHKFQKDVVNRLGQGAAGVGMHHHRPNKPDNPEDVSTPDKNEVETGEWTKVKYGEDDLDCQTTYTCRYGRDFDEV